MSQVNDTQTAVLILAAGKGTRMYSNKPKVLQVLLGEPLLTYVISAAESVCPSAIWIVVGHEADSVREFCSTSPVQFIVQENQLGTGHAVFTALPKLNAAGVKHVLVINGDMPLITSDILRKIIEASFKVDISFATLTLSSPGSYGRVIRNNGELIGILEAKDMVVNQLEEPCEVNTGIYYFSLEKILELLPMITKDNNSQEYYLTDIIALAIKNNLTVKTISFGNDWHLLGINTPKELINAEEVQRASVVEQLLTSGVIIHAPESVRVSPFSVIEPGVEIYGPCEIYSDSYIASGSIIESHCWIKNTIISNNVIIHSFSHLDTVRVEKDCTIGPYARVRPGSVMEQNSHIGNFVEMKKARLGYGAKAYHLSYLGDVDVGEESNIGAGTITCNYDGISKHKTIIGKKAFIGSNSSIVAPVAIGDEALIGAGSVIIKDVPENRVAIARGTQKIFFKKEQ